MKKMLVLSCSAVLLACAGKNANSDAANDSISGENCQDSAKSVTCGMPDPDAGKEPFSPFLSADLSTCSLFGQVKSVKTSIYFSDKDANQKDLMNSFVMEFDEKGTLLKDEFYSFNAKKDKVVRDERGLLKEVSLTCGYEDAMNYHYSFEYENARLKAINADYEGELSGSYVETYSYEGSGELNKIVRQGCSDGIEYVHTSEIMILDSGKSGNWAKRFVKKEQKEAAEENSKKFETNTEYLLEVREITYF